MVSTPQFPTDLLLTSSEGITRNPYFENILNKSDVDEDKEHAKIEYLIERIRESKYKFLRNKKIYSSKRAAKWLSWKYRTYISKVEDAKQWVSEFASYSWETGHPYMIVMPDGTKYPTQGFFQNELQNLEQHLATTI